MTIKTRHCDECECFTRYETPGAVCKLGHRPMFRKPTDDPHNTSWGWKRRCEDFKESTREPDRLP